MELHNLKQNTNDMAALTYWYQPIFNLQKNSILGYEALLRNTHISNFSPMSFFNQAQLEGRHVLLDFALLIKAKDMFKKNSNFLLFLNIFPSTLIHKDFLSWWDMHFKDTSNVVLEISEAEPIHDWDTLKSVVRQLKKRKVRIAVDDMGSGYCFTKHVIELEPDFVKLDCYYSMGITENDLKRRAIESIKVLTDGFCQIIVEGIENEKSLKIMKDLGISWGQGFLLGKPAPLKLL